MSHPPAVPLDRIDLDDAPFVGTKAATLGHLVRTGIPVPNGFVVPTTIYQSFIQANGLTDAIVDLERAARAMGDPTSLRSLVERIEGTFERGEIPPPVVGALRASFRETVRETGAVVVRSSAIGEDLPEASFAGQHSTVLNVRTFEGLIRALRRCWASSFSLSAVWYRARLKPAERPTSIAVLVQAQIICHAAGTMFTVDPLDDAPHLVVEAVWGLGEALAQGEVSPDRYLVDRDTLAESARPRIGDKRCQRVLDFSTGTRLSAVPLWRRRRPVLNRTQLGGLALLGLQIEERLKAPQDVEWGLAGGRWFIFQARPITTRPDVARDETSSRLNAREWTSGFLDERLADPVSPLGWSILQRDLEEIAFREPLRMLGVDPAELEPITRLWKGRPYVNVAVFEALYKLFPDALLPEDADRFFPGRDAGRRRRALAPRSLLSPRIWLGLLGAMARDPLTVSPFHNDGNWERFERRYVRAMAEVGFVVGVLECEAAPDPRTILDLIGEVSQLNRRLLRIHRWSLTFAEVWYSVLRRVARWLIGTVRAQDLCAAAVADLDDYSVQLNRALARLAALAGSSPGEEFQKALAQFLGNHGHRSFSLDVIRPTFADDPEQVLRLIANPTAATVLKRGPPILAEPASKDQRAESASRRPTVPGGEWPGPILAPLVELTRRYARLRENQRLTWQRGLALLRRLYVLAGATLVRQGRLRRADDVFFLRADEVDRAITLPGGDLRPLVAERRRRFAENAAMTVYPRFLRGSQPADEDETDLQTTLTPRASLRGEPVSPGVGRGPARIVLHPDDLAAIEPGDVLVARGADPGWTPIFDRLAALVMETGGQLSHASVVAREYRLPAVVGVSRATRVIRPGENLVVDGSTGVVRRVDRASN